MRAIPLKIFAKHGEICNETTMGKKLEGLGEVRIVDETNGYGLSGPDSSKP